MKIFSLIACVVLFSPLVANAQNAPAPGQRPGMPGLPTAAPSTNAPAPAPGMRPGMPGRPGNPAAVRPQGMPQNGPKPRIVNSNAPLSVAPGETDEVVIYNGVRIGVPAGKIVNLSMMGGQIRIESPSMEGISIGNAVYNTVDPSAVPAEGEEEQPKEAVAATVFVNPDDGGVSVPQNSVPVFVSVQTGDVIEINTYISLKGDVSGALSSEGPAPALPELPTPPAPAPVVTPPTPPAPAPVVAQTQPVAPETTEPVDTTVAEEVFDEMEDYVAPSTVDEIVNDNINEQKDLSSSIRSDAGLDEQE